MPRLRSNIAERLDRTKAPGWRTTVIALSGRDDLDQAALEGAAATVIRLGPLAAAFYLLRRPPAVLEAPEPFWFRFMPLTAALIAAARLGGLARGRRPIVGTYAMENFPAAEALASVRVGVPKGARPVVDALLRRVSKATLALYDAAYWCSPAARDNYLLGTVSAPARWATAGEQELQPKCRCAPEPHAPKENMVLFCAEVTPRKGVAELRAAWELVSAERRGWRMQVIGYGEPSEVVEFRAWAARRQDVTFNEGASREQIHAAFRAAAVLVLPSRRDGYWREQVGYPVLEGLQHGCRIVTTTETGAAGWLTAHSHVVVDPADVGALAAGISLATGPAPVADYDGLPQEDTRQACERFLRSLA